MATLLTDQAIAEMLAGAQPAPPPQAVQAPTPQQMFNLPSPIPQTRFFGGRTSSSRYSDPYTQQERYRKAVMEQMADQQTEALWNELKVTPPDAPDAPARRLQLLTQYPLSQQSEVGKTILSAWDKEAERFHKGVADDKSGDLLGEMAELGANEEEIKNVYDSSGRINTVKARRTIGELKRLQDATKKVQRTQEDLTEDRIKALRDTLEFRRRNAIGNENENTNIETEIFRLERERFGLPAVPTALAAVGTAPAAPATGGVPVTPLGNTFQRSAPRPQ
jgi:hypothetical protein